MRGFIIHLAVFIAVNALLIFINLSTSNGRLWFQWPLIGWSIGIIAHAAAVFLPRTNKESVSQNAPR